MKFILNDIDKQDALDYIEVFNEVDSEIKAKITSEDVTLYNLGFSEKVLCSLDIEITEEQRKKVHEEAYEIELSYAYLEDPRWYSKKDKEIEKRYGKYAKTENMLFDIECILDK